MSTEPTSGFKETAEDLNSAPGVQGNVNPADSITDTDRLAEIRRHMEMAQAATANAPGTFWHIFVADAESLLAENARLQERLDTAEGRLAASRHRHRAYPDAESPHAYCLSCRTGKKETNSSFPEYMAWPCPDAIDLGLAGAENQPPVAPDSEMDPFEAADDIYRRWE